MTKDLSNKLRSATDTLTELKADSNNTERTIRRITEVVPLLPSGISALSKTIMTNIVDHQLGTLSCATPEPLASTVQSESGSTSPPSWISRRDYDSYRDLSGRAHRFAERVVTAHWQETVTNSAITNDMISDGSWLTVTGEREAAETADGNGSGNQAAPGKGTRITLSRKGQIHGNVAWELFRDVEWTDPSALTYLSGAAVSRGAKTTADASAKAIGFVESDAESL